MLLMAPRTVNGRPSRCLMAPARRRPLFHPYCVDLPLLSPPHAESPRLPPTASISLAPRSTAKINNRVLLQGLGLAAEGLPLMITSPPPRLTPVVVPCPLTPVCRSRVRRRACSFGGGRAHSAARPTLRAQTRHLHKRVVEAACRISWSPFWHHLLYGLCINVWDKCTPSHSCIARSPCNVKAAFRLPAIEATSLSPPVLGDLIRGDFF